MKRIIGILVAALAFLNAGAEEFSAPALPQIPEYTVSLTDFGAAGDGVTDNTEAFASAIAALGKAGGGHLVVSAGIYLTGPISLKDRIDLHLERNAMILLNPDKKASLRDGKVVIEK